MNFQFSRYDQHIELPGVGMAGQKKFHTAKVLIVGAGGLGNPVAAYLTAAGIGTLGIVDADVVESSNLQRQILFNDDDLGKLKVLALKDKLDRLAHHQTINIYPYFLDEQNADDLIGAYDVVVDATDNHIARLTVNRVCLAQQKPWVYGALFHFEGQIMAFDPRSGGPCFKCVFTDVDEHSKLPTCKLAGVLSPLPGVIGSLQAAEALKLILNLGQRQDKKGGLYLLNILTYASRSLNVARNENCPQCGRNANSTEKLERRA